MLQATQQAKDDLVSVQCVAREAVGLSQAFVSGGSSVAAAAYPSHAERTLARYSSPGSGMSVDGSKASDGGGSRNGKVGLWPCFGCGGPHPWSQFVDGKHIMICPNKDNPGVTKNAAKGIETRENAAKPEEVSRAEREEEESRHGKSLQFQQGWPETNLQAGTSVNGRLQSEQWRERCIIHDHPEHVAFTQRSIPWPRAQADLCGGGCSPRGEPAQASHANRNSV